MIELLRLFAGVAVIAAIFVAIAACAPEPQAADPDPSAELELRLDKQQQTIHRLRRRVKRWHRYARKLERHDSRLRHALLTSGSVAEAINLAGATYGQTRMLWRKARCESKFSPRARNRSGASGLFQFLPSTFRSTPYGGFSIWSPYANALAAGWMHARGRSNEWACR